MGVDLKLNHPIKSMRELLDKGGFDAVFVGAGAPKGKELKLPGRKEGGANIHIGITWLESVAFEHIKSIGEKVLIIGVGNTAMDCCRTSLRLGAKDVKVMARKPRQFFKASAWELEDAEEEHVKIVINRSPKTFVVEDGKLKGMTFDVMEYDIDAKGRITAERITGEEFLEADDVILAIGQENAFPWIERDLGIEFDKWDVPKVDVKTFESTRAGVFFGGDAAFGPKNIIWAVEHGHQAAISIHNYCQGKSVTDRLRAGREPAVRPRWACTSGPTRTTTTRPSGASCRMCRSRNASRSSTSKSSSASPPSRSRRKCSAASTATCRRCSRPSSASSATPASTSARWIASPSRTTARKPTCARGSRRRRRMSLRPCTYPSPLKHTGRVMVKDEDLCVHCGLCAERCPTAAWDMQKSFVQWPHAKDEAAGRCGEDAPIA